jgi:hypothetical protein
MHSHKIRTAIFASVAVAALSLPGAAAAVVVRGPATASPVHVAQPVTTAQTTEVGSAGVPGYDNQKCEDLLTKAGELRESGLRHSLYGNRFIAQVEYSAAETLEQAASDNCLVIDDEVGEEAD